MRTALLFCCLFVISSVNAQQRVLVTLDRSVYLAGESVWYSVLAPFATNAVATNNQLLLVAELRDMNNRIIFQQLHQLQSGSAGGVFHLPLSLPTGWYQWNVHAAYRRSYMSGPVLIVNPTDSSLTEFAYHKEMNIVAHTPAQIASDSLSMISLPTRIMETRSLCKFALNLPEFLDAAKVSVSVRQVNVLDDASVSKRNHSMGFLDFADSGDAVGSTIRVMFTEKRSGNPSPGVLAFLSLAGKYPRFITAVSDSTGYARFPISKGFLAGDLVVHSAAPNLGEWNITLDELVDMPQVIPSGALPKFDSTQINQIERRYIAGQLKRAFDSTTSSSEKRLIDSLWMGRPAADYRLNEYTRFTTMEEILREYIVELRARKQDSGYTVFVRNGSFPGFFETPPLILLDGVMVQDATSFMNLDPLKLSSIQVYTQTILLGGFVRNGLINAFSISGKEGMQFLPKDAVAQSFPGIFITEFPPAPNYKAMSDRVKHLPDHRTVLFWMPEVQLLQDIRSRELSFYTSDVKGRFKIVVCGIDNKGNPIRAESFFEVK